MAVGVAGDSSRCEKAATGLVEPLDTSNHCGHRRSMLAGRGAGVGSGRDHLGTGSKSDPSTLGRHRASQWHQGCGAASPLMAQAHPSLLPNSPLQPLGPPHSSCNLLSDLLREQTWRCLSSDWGQGRLVGPLLAPAWPQGQPGTHHFCWHHTALQPGLVSLSLLTGCKRVIRPGRQRWDTGPSASGPRPSRGHWHRASAEPP